MKMNSQKTAFVIMPFSSTTEARSEAVWTEIYENVFKPAIEDCGYSCERAIPRIGNLIRSIIEKLKDSTIVLADITDRNPNVLYELGVRHSLSKRTIIVSQKVDDIPSDLKGSWSIIYGTSPGEVTKFRADIRRLISEIEENPNKSDSPVSDYMEREDPLTARAVSQIQIDEILRDRFSTAEVLKNLSPETRSIKVLAISSMASILPARIYEKLPTVPNAKIRWLLLNPDSPHVATRAKENPTRTAEGLNHHILAAISHIQEVKYSNNLENLCIRVYDEHPVFRAIIIDDKAYMSYYPRTGSADATPVWCVRENDSWLFHAIDKYFDSLWERSRDAD